MWLLFQGPLTNPISPSSTGLYIWDYDTPNSVPEKLKLEKFDDKAKTFHPLGIDYIASGRKLFVVNLSVDRVGIEIFKLSAADRKLSHVRTMSHDLISTPNAIASFNGSQFFATNDHYFEKGINPLLSTLETYLALPGGNFIHGNRPAKFKQGEELDVKIMDRLPFANGIAFLNATTLAVASCGRLEVNLYNVQPTGDTHPTLTHIHTISLPFLIDNVKSDKRGTLFLAGHPHPPSIEHMAKNAANCASPHKAGCEKGAKGLSWISEWSEAGGLKDVYVGDEYPTSSAMIKDAERGLGMAVGLYARGVLTWEEKEV